MPTMTDARCVNTYVNELCFGVFKQWRKWSPEQRALGLHQAVGRVHEWCGVPATAGRVAFLGRNNGQFQFARWAIEMNSLPFFEAAMDASNIHPYFVQLAGLLYQEARYCEQWWHMARYLASNARSPGFLAEKRGKPVLRTLPVGSAVITGEGAAWIAETMGIPEPIARCALDKPMDGRDPMRPLAEACYRSVYGDSNRRAVLAAVAMKRMNARGESTGLMKDYRDRFHPCSGRLPEEKDAWAVRDLVRNAFKRFQLVGV